MTVEAAVFTCSICGEPSKEICTLCTKDACPNHRCERCKRCSDCCECDVPLSAEEVRPVEETPAAVAEPVPQTSDAIADAQAVLPPESGSPESPDIRGTEPLAETVALGQGAVPEWPISGEAPVTSTSASDPLARGEGETPAIEPLSPPEEPLR